MKACNKLPTQLVRDSQLVVVGDVSSQNLATMKVAENVYDANWAPLMGMLRHNLIAQCVISPEINEAYSTLPAHGNASD